MKDILTLKDIDKLEVGRIYKVGNLNFFKDTNGADFVLSKYPQEEMWHPFYKTDKFFIEIQDLPIEQTSLYIS